eukprot:1770866-Rhodomonas_salina.2
MLLPGAVPLLDVDVRGAQVASPVSLCSSALATPCPDAFSGTDTGYRRGLYCASVLRSCYGMSGTHASYVAAAIS